MKTKGVGELGMCRVAAALPNSWAEFVGRTIL
jgi:hypothetical protein